MQTISVQNIIRKTAMALFLALIFIASFHKALADDGVLGQVSSIAPKSKDKLMVTCGDLQAQVNSFASEITADGIVLSQYADQAGKVYASWAQILTPFEDQKHMWATDYFKPIEASTKNLDATGDELYSWVDVYSQKLGQFQGALENCMPDAPARKKALGALASFATEMSDAQTSSAGFVSDMKSRLVDWNHLWHALEGTTTRVPPGYFQSLVKGSNDLTEASQLFQENASLLSEHFKAVFAGFDAALSNY
jgi:hypothetical protein